MAKYPTKRLNNQSNQRVGMHLQAKDKCPNKPSQKSARKMESTNVNSIMEQ